MIKIGGATRPSWPFVVLSSLIVISPESVFAVSEVHERALSRSRPSMECSIALNVLRAVISRTGKPTDILALKPPEFPMVADQGSDGQIKTIRLEENSEFWRVGWVGQTPTANLVHRWFRAPYRSASGCIPGEKDSNRALNTLPGTGWTSSSIHSKSLSVGGSTTIQMTEPVFDEQKRQALILYSSAGPGLGGKVELILLDNAGTVWREAGSRILSVS